MKKFNVFDLFDNTILSYLESSLFVLFGIIEIHIGKLMESATMQTAAVLVVIVQVVCNLGQRFAKNVTSVKNIGKLGVLDAFNLLDDVVLFEDVFINQMVDLCFQVSVFTHNVCHAVRR